MINMNLKANLIYFLQRNKYSIPGLPKVFESLKEFQPNLCKFVFDSEKRKRVFESLRKNLAKLQKINDKNKTFYLI